MCICMCLTYDIVCYKINSTLHYNILDYTMCSTVLHYTIVYYTMLCYIMLCYAMLSVLSFEVVCDARPDYYNYSRTLLEPCSTTPLNLSRLRILQTLNPKYEALANSANLKAPSAKLSFEVTKEKSISEWSGFRCY